MLCALTQKYLSWAPNASAFLDGATLTRPCGRTVALLLSSGHHLPALVFSCCEWDNVSVFFSGYLSLLPPSLGLLFVFEFGEELLVHPWPDTHAGSQTLEQVAQGSGGVSILGGV